MSQPWNLEAAPQHRKGLLACLILAEALEANFESPADDPDAKDRMRQALRQEARKQLTQEQSTPDA